MKPLHLTNKHLKAVKNLIKSYNSATADDCIKAEKAIIKERRFYSTSYPSSMIANKLIGVGSINTCTLCKTSIYGTDIKDYNCDTCIHIVGDNNGSSVPCINDTYMSTTRASNTEELLDSFKLRANYLQTLIDKYNETK